MVVINVIFIIFLALFFRHVVGLHFLATFGLGEAMWLVLSNEYRSEVMCVLH